MSTPIVSSALRQQPGRSTTATGTGVPERPVRLSARVPVAGGFLSVDAAAWWRWLRDAGGFWSLPEIAAQHDLDWRDRNALRMHLTALESHGCVVCKTLPRSWRRIEEKTYGVTTHCKQPALLH